MANLLFFLALMLFPLFFLTQTVTLRFQYYKEPVISIDFILFALFFFPERKRRKRRRKKRNIRKAFKFLSASLRPLEYFLKGSEFEVRNFEIFNNGSEPDEAALKFQRLRSFFSAAYVFLAEKSKKVIIADRIFEDVSVYNTNEGFGRIDILLYTSIKNMLFSFFYLVFSAYGPKRIKEG